MSLNGNITGGYIPKVDTTLALSGYYADAIAIYKDSVSATGFVQGVYIASEGTMHYTYCSSYSAYLKQYATSTSTASSVSGGTFTLGTSGTSGLTSSTTYNWFAVGEE